MMNEFQRKVLTPIDAELCVVDEPKPRLPDFERPANPQLVAQGWERRFMADGTRLTEYLELYSSLGFEVRTEAVQPEEIGPECDDCRLMICRQFVTLYTRRRSGSSGQSG
jgi:hypothetical protein